MAELEQVVATVMQDHPECALLRELLSIQGPAPAAELALEEWLRASNLDVMARLARASTPALGTTATTIAGAVRDVGFRPLHSMAVTAVAVETLGGHSHTLDETRFWRNAIAVGLLGMVGATVLGTHHDEAFTAGLLHRTGLLLLDHYAPAEFARALNRIEHNFSSIDEAVTWEFPFAPSDLAGAVFQRWGLPQWLVESTSYPASESEAIAGPGSLPGLVLRARVAALARGFGDERLDGDILAPRTQRLLTQPLATLDRIGGETWLRPRVDAFASMVGLATPSPDDTARD